jgi:hypothetical protein
MEAVFTFTAPKYVALTKKYRKGRLLSLNSKWLERRKYMN